MAAGIPDKRVDACLDKARPLILDGRGPLLVMAWSSQPEARFC